MNKKSFVIYCDIGDQLELLTDEQVGVLFRSVVKYASNEEELSSNDGMVKLLFSVIKKQIDRDTEKYKTVCERRREAGSKGGKQKVANAKQNLANVANASNCNQNLANVADNDSDNDSDSVSDTLSLNGESVREGANKVFDLQSIKEQLLSDEIWKESVCMQSTLGVSFISMLPDQLDKFIAYIVSIGEERSISNISDAKRRFTYWWQNHGRKEVQDENKQVYTVPN